MRDAVNEPRKIVNVNLRYLRSRKNSDILLQESQEEQQRAFVICVL